MRPLYEVNGLMFWDEREIRTRNRMIEEFSSIVQMVLRKENAAWQFVQVEAPLLTPTNLLNPNYTSDDVFTQMSYEVVDSEVQIKGGDLTLRPETTPGSYRYAEFLLDSHMGYKPPLCVWQAGKSFRQEQDQVIKNMRLKEFYQQEFQCIYSIDTLNDYHAAVLSPISYMLSGAIGLPTRVIPSDRLPSYAEITMDVEVLFDTEHGFAEDTERWMEVCSISRRKDFPSMLRFDSKKGIIEKEARVLEIAIGLDRCVYARHQYLKSIGDEV